MIADPILTWQRDRLDGTLWAADSFGCVYRVSPVWSGGAPAGWVMGWVESPPDAHPVPRLSSKLFDTPEAAQALAENIAPSPETDAELAAAEVAADHRRDNRLEPGFRRAGQ